jgi:hypothetical protein
MTKGFILGEFNQKITISKKNPARMEEKNTESNRVEIQNKFKDLKEKIKKIRVKKQKTI